MNEERWGVVVFQHPHARTPAGEGNKCGSSYHWEDSGCVIHGEFQYCLTLTRDNEIDVANSCPLKKCRYDQEEPQVREMELVVPWTEKML